MVAAEPVAMFAAASVGWLVENEYLLRHMNEPGPPQRELCTLMAAELDRRGVDRNIVTPFRREE